MKQNYKIQSNNQVLQISGLYPGVGKSYLIPFWKETLEKAGYKVEVGATTHRSSTISHKTASSIFDDSIKINGYNYFINPTLHKNTKKIFIIDEAYLWSKTKWNHIFNAYPNSKFILIGDDAQFDPVDGYKALDKAHIYLNKIHRQSDPVFINFIKNLRNGIIDIDYIKKNCYRRHYKSYIGVSYTKEISKSLQSTVSIKHSDYYHDDLYSFDNNIYYTLANNEQATLLGIEYNKNGINMHQLQGLTLKEDKLAFDLHIDDFLLNHLDVLLRFLYVSFTRITNISQMYISEKEISKLEKVYLSLLDIIEKNCNEINNFEEVYLSLLDIIEKNCNEINNFEEDSSVLKDYSIEQINDLFDKYGYNAEKSNYEVILGKTRFDELIKERMLNPISKDGNEKLYKPINPMNRKTWAKQTNDLDGCSSHHWYCFECDYKDRASKYYGLTEKAWSEAFKEDYVEKHLNMFFCVIFSGHSSYHCFVYNDYEPSQVEYNAIWDKLNELLFDNQADTACKCYNPHLVRAPFVIRPETGKEQKLVYFTGNTFCLPKHIVIEEKKIEIERLLIKEAISDRNSIDAEIVWVSEHWTITNKDGTGRYRTLCSIADNISKWKYRKLSAEAIIEVITKIGNMMNLGKQRIDNVIKNNSEAIYNFKSDIIEDWHTKDRQVKAEINQFRHNNAIELSSQIFASTLDFRASIKYYLWYCNNYHISYDFDILEKIKSFEEKDSIYLLFDIIEKNCNEINENQPKWNELMVNLTEDELRRIFENDDEVVLYDTKSNVAKNKTKTQIEAISKSVSEANKTKRQKFWNLLPEDYTNLSQADMYQIFKENGISSSSASQAAKKIKIGEWVK